MRFEYDKKLIGERLRFYRKKCNLTAEDVKEYLSLGSVQAIYKWENGTTIPAVDNFLALMELYGIDSFRKLIKPKGFNLLNPLFIECHKTGMTFCAY